MEISGGAEKLSRTLINFMGQSKAAWAMMIVAYICGIPVFLQVGIVLLTPILFCVVLESKQPLVKVALGMLTSLTVVHCIVPPHPAAMAITLALKADVGKVIFYGLLVGIPASIIAGPLFGGLIAKKNNFQPPEAYCKLEPTPAEKLPPFGITLFTILLPLMAPGLLSGAIVAFAAAMGEFGAVITFVSNIPGQTQTLPLAIYAATQEPGGDAVAARLAAISFGVALIALMLSEFLAHRVRRLIGQT